MKFYAKEFFFSIVPYVQKYSIERTRKSNTKRIAINIDTNAIYARYRLNRCVILLRRCVFNCAHRRKAHRMPDAIYIKRYLKTHIGPDSIHCSKCHFELTQQHKMFAEVQSSVAGMLCLWRVLGFKKGQLKGNWLMIWHYNSEWITSGLWLILNVE